MISDAPCRTLNDARFVRSTQSLGFPPTPLLHVVLIGEPDVVPNLIRLKPEGLRSPYAWQHGDVVEFRNGTFEPQPMHDVPISQVDDKQPALGILLTICQLRVQWQSRKRLFVAWFRNTNHCEIPDKRQPAWVTRQKCDILKGAARQVDISKVPSPRIEHPQLATLQPWRMGHGKSQGNDGV